MDEVTCCKIDGKTVQILQLDYHQQTTRLAVVSCLLSAAVFLQCSDTVCWATGRASGLQNKTGCWFVVGDDLTGALHVLSIQQSCHHHHIHHP